jgi:multiple sugar transport system permease protein
MPARVIGNPRTAWLLLSGLLAFVVLLLGFPLVINVIYSFSQVHFSGLFSPRWLGLGNYLAVLSDPVFWKAVQFSFAFGLVATFAEIVLGLSLALFLAPLVASSFLI